MQSVLVGFLKNNLLNIGDDDGKLLLLEQAATDLAAKIEKTPLLAQRFALAGFTEGLPASDPVYKLAESAVTEKWTTIANKIGSDPVQVYRAVALRALQLAGQKNAQIRYAVALVAQGMPAVAFAGKAHEPVTVMLGEFVKATVDEVSAVWVNPVDINFPKLPTKVRKVAGLKEEIAAGMSRSVGPTDAAGKAQSDPNPHWPNNHQAWALEFASRASETVAAAVHSGAKGFADDIAEAIKESLVGWCSALEKLAVRDAKGELLWLKMSLYSPSATKSFRALNPSDLILHSAIDTSRAVPGFAPVSVEYFLRELIGGLTTVNVTFGDFMRATGPSLRNLPEGKSVLAEDTLPAEGRRSWLSVAVQPGADSLEAQAGIADGFAMSSADLAVHLYRELQIRKLLSPAT